MANTNTNANKGLGASLGKESTTAGVLGAVIFAVNELLQTLGVDLGWEHTAWFGAGVAVLGAIKGLIASTTGDRNTAKFDKGSS